MAAGELTASLAISGSLSARSRVAVVPKMSGTLTKVLVDIGSRVRAGQTVALQDTRELDAQVDAATAAVAVAKASLEQAEASLANAKLEYDRSKNLFEKGALARQRLDSSDTALRTAKAAARFAEATAQQVDASFRRAREVRRDAILTAPTSGVVVERNYDSGALVGPGDNKGVVVVADTGELKLQAGVSELDAGRLRVGMPALISVQARPGQTWTGRLVALAPEVDARNRHFQIEVRVQNEKDELLSGMYATASIETGHVASTVLVPREAVTSRDGAWVVYRVVNNVATPVRVTEGLSRRSAHSDPRRPVGGRRDRRRWTQADRGRHDGTPGQGRSAGVTTVATSVPPFAERHHVDFEYVDQAAGLRHDVHRELHRAWPGVDGPARRRLVSEHQLPLHHGDGALPGRGARGSGDAGHQAHRRRRRRHQRREAHRVALA